MELKIILRFVAQHWKIARQELQYDLRNTRWAWGFAWFLFFVVWCGGLITALISVTSAATTNNIFLFGSISPCLPDGSFSLQPDLYNPWTTSGVFEITLGFGSLSFANAKLIDVIWDIVVGRGTQTILTLILFHVFAKYITATMAVSPISYATHRTLFLRVGPNTTSIFTLLREFTLYRSLDSKVAMIWIILSSAFIAAFPSWVSAMSGYSGNSGAFIRDQNGNYEMFSSLNIIDYVVHDGQRVGLGPEYFMLGNYSHFSGDYTSDIFMCDATFYDEYPECLTRQNISNYTKEYGFFGTNNVTSTFGNYTLQPPALNISAFYISNPDLWGYNWTDPATGQQPFNNMSQATWALGNDTYDYTYMLENGSCQPLGTYKWGFSFTLLFAFLFTLTIWTIGTYILWLHAHLTLRIREMNEVPGEYKAIIQLAAAMHQEFNKEGEDPSTLKEHELSAWIRRELKGGSIMYDSVTQNLKYRFSVAFARWFRTEKWWILACCCAGASISLVVNGLALLFFPLLSLTGIVFAMLMGRKLGSRLLILLFFMVLGAFISIILSAVN